MDDHHGLEGVTLVGGEPRLDSRGIDAATPVAGHVLDRDAQSLRELLPERRKMPGLEGEHAIARRERVDERRFPGARAGSAIDRDRRLRAEDPLHARDHVLGEREEIGSAVIDGGAVDRAQHPVRYIGRTGDLQEVAAAALRHGLRPP